MDFIELFISNRVQSFVFLLGNVESFTTSVWISYGFIHFAYFVLLFTPLLVRKSEVDTDYRRPLYLITGTFFLISSG